MLKHHTYVVEAQPYQEVTIFVFGDLQAGSKGFNAEIWQEFVNQFKATKRAYAIGVGDYGDWLRPSMRERLNSTLTKDDSAKQQLDDIIRKDHDHTIERLKFMKGHIIGLHQGHHTWEFRSGESTDQRLAEALCAPYLGWTASTRLVIRQTRGKGRDPRGYCYTILSTHGNANGRKVGAAANWLEGNIVQGFLADQYIMGHGCKSANFVPHAIDVVRRIGQPGLDRRVPRCLIVGGFAEGYTNGYESSYVERAGYAPQPLGWGVIRLKVVQRKADALAHGVGTGRDSGRISQTLSVEQLNITP